MFNLRSYDPDFVLVSAGFDAAIGHEHPIGKHLPYLINTIYMCIIIMIILLIRNYHMSRFGLVN